MFVATASQSIVLGPAARVVLDGHPGPVVNGVAESLVYGVAADDDKAFARALGYRRHSAKSAQGVVVSPLQRLVCFCKQRGEDRPSYSGKRCEDGHVALPARRFCV